MFHLSDLQYWYSDFINKMNPDNKNIQLSIKPLFDIFNETIQTENKNKIIKSAKKLNPLFDINQPYYQIIFLKRCVNIKPTYRANKINILLKQNKLSKLCNYLEFEEKNYNEHNLDFKNLMFLFQGLRSVLGDNDIHRMYFCDVLNKNITSAKRTFKLQSSLKGLYGSYTLSGVHDFMNQDKVNNIIKSINPEFDSNVETYNLYHFASILYFDNRKTDLEKIKKQFLDYASQKNKSVQDIHKDLMEKYGKEGNEDFEKYQKMKVLENVI